MRRINEKYIEVTNWDNLFDEGRIDFITDLSDVLIQINVAIIRLQRQMKLQNELNKINNGQHELFEKQIKVEPISFITKTEQRLAKLEKLTNADDYEYQTMPAETKLVKKQSPTASKHKKAGE